MPDRLQLIRNWMAAPIWPNPREDAEWLVAELEASRAAGDQLRAVFDDLIWWARAGAACRSPISQDNIRTVEGHISHARRLLDAMQSPTEREPAP
jgi:hypothetical protein